jgi:hypothetical protein
MTHSEFYHNSTPSASVSNWCGFCYTTCKTGATPSFPILKPKCEEPLTPHRRRRHLPRRTASLPPSPPYKRHPRAPSPHHLPIPRIGSLHPRPYCPPIELCHRPSVPTVAGSPPAVHRPAPPLVRTTLLPSPFALRRSELPSTEEAERTKSGEPRHPPCRESMVDSWTGTVVVVHGNVDSAHAVFI